MYSAHVLDREAGGVTKKDNSNYASLVLFTSIENTVRKEVIDLSFFSSFKRNFKLKIVLIAMFENFYFFVLSWGCNIHCICAA
jgi:hypothetical protein